MSILGEMKSGFPGRTVESALGSGQSPLIGAAARLVLGAGGLEGVMRKFRENGIGDVVQSWVSDGPNQPVSERQLESVFGRSEIEKAASGTGLSHDTLLQQLARALPSIIDRLTPGGRVPASGLQESDIRSVGLDWLKSALH